MPKVPLLDLISYIHGSVVLKISEDFPDYTPGEDVDLLVLDRQNAIKSISCFFEENVDEQMELKVTDTPAHSHVDFLIDGKLQIRIDLIDAFDFYTKISVKNGFVAKIFKDRQKLTFDNYTYYVPCFEDDLTIRYFECLEYFDQRPDKVKHLEYICDIKDEALKRRFFHNTHNFIRFKRKTWINHAKNIEQTQNITSRRKAFKNILANFNYLIRTSIKTWLKRFREIF